MQQYGLGDLTLEITFCFVTSHDYKKNNDFLQNGAACIPPQLSEFNEFVF